MTAEKPLESLSSSKKTGSSSESSGSSSDSEAEGPGGGRCEFDRSNEPMLKLNSVRSTVCSGIIKQQKKKGQSVKEGKKTQPHVQTAPAQALLNSQTAGFQSSAQLKQHQPPPADIMAPPVTALESSQILETGFESLPPFGQPLMHLSHHTGGSSPPAPPHLNAHSAGPVSPETHPFLNQHPVLTSPGKLS